MKASRSRYFVICLVSLLVVLSLPVYSLAVIVFQEDFESYVDGSNLDGQGGWSFGPVGDDYPLTVGQGLSGGKGIDSMVANGFISGPSMVSNFSFTLETGNIYILSFDAYASYSDPLSDNSYLGLSARAPDEAFGARPDITIAWGYEGDVPATGNVVSWHFWSPGGYGNYYIYGGVETIVKPSIIIDPIKMETYGILEFNGLQYETDRRPITSSFFESIKNITIYEHGGALGNRGIQFDNITLEATTIIPEPATMLLLGSSFLGLAGFRRKFKKT